MTENSNSNNATAKPPLIRQVIDDRLYIAQDVEFLPNSFRPFKLPEAIVYYPLCDDFGPMNIGTVIRFIEILEDEMAEYPTSRIFFCVESGKRELSNAVFLLGAYMILKLDHTSQQVEDCFHWLDDSLVEPFRDATFSKSTFDLTLADCWRGLEKGKAKAWIQNSTDSDGEWGDICVDEYLHYDSPLNGDLHEVVPGQFVAFKGPIDLGDRLYFDDGMHRQFSPSFYLNIFDDLGVKAVVRLNEPEYDRCVFTDHGISHYDLEFEDCTAPPAHIVEAFFKIVDETDGSVAVHCKAGMGRTGTLIALAMMRNEGFSAREAMGWLRMMRPGSVIGEQQRFLCCLDGRSTAVVERLTEARAAASAATDLSRVANDSDPASSASFQVGAASAELARQVATGMERRCLSRAECARAARV